MSRKPRWDNIPLEGGVKIYNLSSWKYFSDFINQEMLDYVEYVYRGHACSSWKLEPTLDRTIKEPDSPIRQQHLDRFKYETRGRRGSNPAELLTENDWWALGQHHGLSTPLLDWSESPFVALFFGANGALETKTATFSVFALAQDAITPRNEIIENNESIKLINGRKPTVKLVRPLSNENNRLVSQRGLFTRGPNNIDLESWIKNNQTKMSHYQMELIKINIPNKDIKDCLRYLNRMNINHSTLFPDLNGASEYCNSHLKVTKY